MEENRGLRLLFSQGRGKGPVRRLKAQYLNQIDFNEFGEVISIDILKKRDPTVQSEIQSYYSEVGHMECGGSAEYGVCIAKERNLEILQMEQHTDTSELLLSMGGDFIVPVAPVAINGGKPIPNIEKLVAVRVLEGEGVVFKPGIWHWTPFPVRDHSFVLVSFRLGTPVNDTTVFDLEEKIIMDL